MGLFGRYGCNNGSCHGSFQGKNGFRLSLFGYEPEKDFAALTHDQSGRRIDRVDPERSLLLMKAAGLMPHDGGMRFGRDSWPYRIMLEWLRQGARWDRGSGAVEALVVTPGELAVGAAAAAGRRPPQVPFPPRHPHSATPILHYACP